VRRQISRNCWHPWGVIRRCLTLTAELVRGDGAGTGADILKGAGNFLVLYGQMFREQVQSVDKRDQCRFQPLPIRSR
jgi:hypothetical protein